MTNTEMKRTMHKVGVHYKTAHTLRRIAVLFASTCIVAPPVQSQTMSAQAGYGHGKAAKVRVSYVSVP